MELFQDVCVDALCDTLVLLPFLFITYLVMEAIEHKASKRIEGAIAHAGVAGPAVGAVLGAIPQCGFSAMAATLFSGGVVSVGTLVAVVFSTSDEMIPVFLAHQENLGRMLAIVGIKLAIGLVFGLVLDAGLRAAGKSQTKQHIHDLCVRASCDCDSGCDSACDHDHACDCGCDHDHDHGHACDCGHDHASSWLGIARCALKHTIQVGAFILLVTFVCGLVIELVGQDTLSAFLSQNSVLAVILAGLIGLIPNCAASVTISELYLQGVLDFGAALAGLLASGGVGLLVLWRTNANCRQNMAITGFVYIVAVAVGLLALALGIIV